MQQIVRIFLVISNVGLLNKLKNLKDQLIIELGKIKPPPSSEHRGENYDPKWTHCRSLLFLKDKVKPRASSRNIK